MWTWPHLVAVALKEGGLAFKNAEQAHIGRFGSLVCARSSAAMRKSTFDEQTRRRKEKKKQKKARARAHTHTRTRTHAIKKTNETGRTSRGPHEVKNQGEVEVVEVVEVVVEVVVEAVVERRPRNREKKREKKKTSRAEELHQFSLSRSGYRVRLGVYEITSLEQVPGLLASSLSLRLIPINQRHQRRRTRRQSDQDGWSADFINRVPAAGHRSSTGRATGN